jgi:quercetin dioxygenase-like cupin family protein
MNLNKIFARVTNVAPVRRRAFRVNAMLVASLALLVPASVINADANDDERGFAIVQSGEEAWQEIPGIAGVSYIKVYGDSSQSGVYVVRVRFDPWTMTMPHYHSQDRIVAVVKGTWYAGTDTHFDPENVTPVGAGGYMLHPAGGVHFDGAKEQPAIVQITGNGPATTTFLDPDGGRSRKLR